MISVKTIGKSGQVSLGKEFSGRQVLIDQVEAGVWVVKLGEFVPDSERWLFTNEVSKNLDEAISWAETHSPQETALDSLGLEGP